MTNVVKKIEGQIKGVLNGLFGENFILAGSFSLLAVFQKRIDLSIFHIYPFLLNLMQTVSNINRQTQ